MTNWESRPERRSNSPALCSTSTFGFLNSVKSDPLLAHDLPNSVLALRYIIVYANKIYLEALSQATAQCRPGHPVRWRESSIYLQHLFNIRINSRQYGENDSFKELTRPMFQLNPISGVENKLCPIYLRLQLWPIYFPQQITKKAYSVAMSMMPRTEKNPFYITFRAILEVSTFWPCELIF